MTIWYRALFLFSSFGPLYLLLFVGLAVQQCWGEDGLYHGGVIAIALSGFAFIGSVVLFLWLRSDFKSSSPSWYDFDPIDSLDENVLTYMLSYIPPLMVDDFSNIEKIIPIIVFYIVLVSMMLSIDSVYVHPLFLIFGYRIYRVKLPSDRRVIVITKIKDIMPSDNKAFYEIQQGKLFYVE